MPISTMRLVFMATGDIALPTFHQLLTQGPRPLALVTQPDKPVGRHQIPTPPRIKSAALAAGIPVLQPLIAGNATAEIASLDPEVIVVMAYGQILRENLLHLPSQAIINLHASLLPKYRGSACIQAAIAAGDAMTGVTAMHVVRQLDAGDIIHAKAIPILPEDTGGTLHDRLALLAADVLADTLPMIAAGNAPRLAQNPSEVSMVTKLTREHGRIDWTRPAAEIERMVRAYDPWPGTYAIADEAGVSRRLKIFPPVIPVVANEMPLAPGETETSHGRLIVGCGDGLLEITTVQPEGGKRLPTSEYLKGKRPARL